MKGLHPSVPRDCANGMTNNPRSRNLHQTKTVPAWKICATGGRQPHPESPSVVAHPRLEGPKNNDVPMKTIIRLTLLITRTPIPSHRLYHPCSPRRVRFPFMNHRLPRGNIQSMIGNGSVSASTIQYLHNQHRWESLSVPRGRWM